MLVQSYDDDAELQARIWNAFAIEKRQSIELTGFVESFRVTITAEQIKNPNRRRQLQNVNGINEAEGSIYDEQ